MKGKLIRSLIALTLIVAAVGVNISQAGDSITPVQTTGAGSFVVNYWWDINTSTNYANLYSNVYMSGDVGIMIYPPVEGNVFWYDSDNFYDVTVPSNWTKDYSHGIGGQTDIIGAGIGQLPAGKGKQFIHYSSGLFDSPTITGGLNSTLGQSYSFIVNVPTQLVNTTVVPEPISSVLFITGGTLLAWRSFFIRKS